MKKIFVIMSVLAISACGGMIKNQNGSENLVRLNRAPTDCKFLYEIESEASVYEKDDAVIYLENRIAERGGNANAYMITDQYSKSNEWVMFGPERAQVLAANVYYCPNLNK